MNSRRAPPSQEELKQAIGLRRLMEHLFPGRAQAVTDNFLRAHGDIEDRNDTTDRKVISMSRSRFGLITAPIGPKTTNAAHRHIVDTVLTLINACPDKRLRLASLARKLAMKKETIEQAIKAVGSEADHDFMLVIMDDQTTRQPYVEVAPRPYDIYERILVPERKEIAAKCAELIQDDDVVFIDGGVHTYEAYLAICDRIMRGTLHNIKVVTSSIRVSVHKRDKWLSANLTVVQTGGIVRPDGRKTCYGPASVRDFAEHAAAAVTDHRRAVGLVGVTYITKLGCAVNTHLELDAKLELMKLKYVVVLGDHKKWLYQEHGHVFAPFNTWPPKRFIVSDKRPPEKWLQWANTTFDEPTNIATVWTAPPRIIDRSAPHPIQNTF
jgi:DeoR/GlpR family transcriptional regulator of sugar metabolism